MPTLGLYRQTHLFAAKGASLEELARTGRPVRLAPDQLLHPDVPADGIVRLGRLRVSQLFPDGREVTRAVLQAGAAFLTRADPHRGADAAADVYLLSDLILMAIGEAELWLLPAGSLELDS